MAATARLRRFAGHRVMRTNIWQPSLAFLSLGLQVILALHLAPCSTAAWNARSKMATLYCASVSIGGNRVTFVTWLFNGASRAFCSGGDLSHHCRLTRGILFCAGEHRSIANVTISRRSEIEM
jgi:hypothetical protein